MISDAIIKSVIVQAIIHGYNDSYKKKKGGQKFYSFHFTNGIK